MNFIISLDSVIKIARALAAAQILTDDNGNGDREHPLAFLLEDCRRGLFGKFFRMGFSEVCAMLLYQLDDYSDPYNNSDHLTVSIAMPRNKPAASGGMLLHHLEQAVAYKALSIILTFDGSERDAIKFDELADHHIDAARNIIGHRPFILRPRPVY